MYFCTMSEPKRYTITAALPYANGPLHIGHLAGAYIAADIYARYLRLQGKDVIFVCGSDEHGAAITIKAKKENTTPTKKSSINTIPSSVKVLRILGFLLISITVHLSRYITKLLRSFSEY
jgi:methionyl-tRNA synthetase